MKDEKHPAESLEIKLSPNEAASYLKSKGVPYTQGSLAVLRCRGRGPRFVKIGRRCYYRREDLDRFLDGVVVETTDSVSVK